jgi:hypothetical protein
MFFVARFGIGGCTVSPDIIEEVAVMSATASARHPVLDRAEWDLVVQLLERECRDLPLEIHHTATKEYRQLLRDRLNRAEALLDRVKPLAA